MGFSDNLIFLNLTHAEGCNMNIFFTSRSPVVSARHLCDKHVPKMLLETCQMLSTGLQRHTGLLDELYKPAYPNHPMTKWVGDSYFNFGWALYHATELAKEFEFRFKKEHKSKRIVNFIHHNMHICQSMPITKGGWTAIPLCMPDKYKTEDVFLSYRLYYNGEKSHFAKWEKGRKKPTWVNF